MYGLCWLLWLWNCNKKALVWWGLQLSWSDSDHQGIVATYDFLPWLLYSSLFKGEGNSILCFLVTNIFFYLFSTLMLHLRTNMHCRKLYSTEWIYVNKLGLSWAKLSSSWDWTLIVCRFGFSEFSLIDLVWYKYDLVDLFWYIGSGKLDSEAS